MSSRAIARLDEWLRDAERVLEEQREAALSPSQAAAWDPARETSTLALGDFERGLGDLLRRLCESPGRWILIAEDACHPNLFCQFLGCEDGSLIAETVTNTYLESEERLTPEQESTLARLGWEAPDPAYKPNWLWVEDTTSPDVEGVVRFASATLREVFGLGDEDRLVVKMFALAATGRDASMFDCRRGCRCTMGLSRRT